VTDNKKTLKLLPQGSLKCDSVCGPEATFTKEGEGGSDQATEYSCGFPDVDGHHLSARGSPFREPSGVDFSGQQPGVRTRWLCL